MECLGNKIHASVNAHMLTYGFFSWICHWTLMPTRWPMASFPGNANTHPTRKHTRRLRQQNIWNVFQGSNPKAVEITMFWQALAPKRLKLKCFGGRGPVQLTENIMFYMVSVGAGLCNLPKTSCFTLFYWARACRTYWKHYVLRGFNGRGPLELTESIVFYVVLLGAGL